MTFVEAFRITWQPVSTEPVKRILATPGVLEEAVDVRARRRDDVDDAGREARPPAELADRQARLRRRGRGLEDDGVSGRQAGRQLDHRDREREVPGRDDRDDAERLVTERGRLVREEDLLVVDRLRSEQLLGVAGEVAERVRGRDEVEGPRLGDGLSLLERDEAREVVVGLPDHLEEVREVLLPLLRAPRAPVEERLPRGRDRGVDLLRPCPVDLGEPLPRRRIPGEERLPGRDVLAVDDRPGRQGEALLQIIAPRVIFSTCLR